MYQINHALMGKDEICNNWVNVLNFVKSQVDLRKTVYFVILKNNAIIATMLYQDSKLVRAELY